MTFLQNPGSLSPVFDYSSRDYSAILSDLLARQQVYLPEWTSQSNNDFGIVLLQEFAYACDILHYYMDRLSGEAFIQTATQPQSILNLAQLIGYTPYLSTGATVVIQVAISSALPGGSYPVDIPAGTQFSTTGTSTQPPIIFTTLADLSIAGTAAATPIFVGSVNAIQGIQYNNEAVAVSNGTVNQSYVLQNKPVSGNSFTVSVDLGLGPQPWKYVSTLTGQPPTAFVFTNFVDANQNFYIVFGDGVNGYVPPLGSPITCTYQTNSGALGNVGANTINVYLNPPQGDPRVVGITTITNPLSASGGAPQESIQSIQSQAPASLTTLNRAVTVNDLNILARNLSGFAWASAVQQTYQLVNLYMAPNGGGNLSALQVTNVEAAVSQYVMANTTVTVLSPNYSPIDITANVTAFANFSNLATQQLIIQALDNYLALNNTGFGFRVTLGEVYQVILSTTGVNYAAVTELQREVFCTLNAPIVLATQYQTLTTTQLPQQINSGDTIILTNGTQTQTLVASNVAPQGAFSIPVATFTANANYPIGTNITDTTLLTDAVFLESEIPTLGVLTINVTGGTTP